MNNNVIMKQLNFYNKYKLTKKEECNVLRLADLELFLQYHNRKYMIVKSEDIYKLYYKENYELKFATDSIEKLGTYLEETMFYDKYFSYSKEYDCLLDFIKLKFPIFSIKPIYNSFGLYNDSTLIVKFDYNSQIVDYFKKNYDFSYKKLYPYICRICHRPFERVEQKENATIYSCKYCRNKIIELL